MLVSSLLHLVLGDAVCPDKPAATDTCIQVNDWNDLKTAIASSTGAVVLCPFDITKTERDPIMINNGVTAMCRKVRDDDECTIRGGGEHIHSTSTAEVIFLGFSFKESDEHAVYIQSSIPTNVHTFCDCIFEA